MRLLFVADPLARLNPKKDSTVALMRAAARLGDEVFFAEAADLSVDENGAAVAAKKLNIRESDLGMRNWSRRFFAARSWTVFLCGWSRRWILALRRRL